MLALMNHGHLFVVRSNMVRTDCEALLLTEMKPFHIVIPEYIHETQILEIILYRHLMSLIILCQTILDALIEFPKLCF